MAKVKIFKKDGTPTPYFWSEERDGADKTSVTVFKRTDDGVKRMRGVRFNAVTNTMMKD